MGRAGGALFARRRVALVDVRLVAVVDVRRAAVRGVPHVPATGLVASAGRVARPGIARSHVAHDVRWSLGVLRAASAAITACAEQRREAQREPGDDHDEG